MSKTTYGVRVSILLAAMACGIDAAAQNDTINSVDRSVDVVNAYQPTLRRSKKISIDPVVDDTVKYSNSFEYQMLQRVSTVTTKPEPLSAAGMDFPIYKSPYRAMVEGGVGSLPSFYGQIIYNNGNSQEHHLTLKAGHMAQLGKVKLEEGGKVEAHRNDTWAGVDYNHFGGNLRFGFDVDFANNAYSYFGQNSITDTLAYLSEDGGELSGGDVLRIDKQRNLYNIIDDGVDVGNRLLHTFSAITAFISIPKFQRLKFTGGCPTGYGRSCHRSIHQGNLRLHGGISS